MEKLDQLIQEGASLKMKIAAMSQRLKEVNQAIAPKAEFKDGSKTGYLVGGGFKVKVVNRENMKWNQKSLETVRQHFKVFDSVFKSEFKPKSFKDLKEAMLRDAEFEKAVNWARTVTPGAPTITYEEVGDGS